MGDELTTRDGPYYAAITWSLPVFAASLPVMFVWCPLWVGVAVLALLVAAGLAEAFGRRSWLTGLGAAVVLALAVDLVAVPAVFFSAQVFG
jgi:hypothetical protein